jgi:hypothetical protein
LLKGVDRDDLCFIVSLDELSAADSKFTIARFNTVILHPPGIIRGGGEYELVPQWDGRGDIPHLALTIGVSKVNADHRVLS